jgi:hypothetical protein
MAGNTQEFIFFFFYFFLIVNIGKGTYPVFNDIAILDRGHTKKMVTVIFGFYIFDSDFKF